MALILGIESATTLCSIALFEAGNVLASKEMDEGYSHAENLAVFVQELIAENLGGDSSRIDAVALSAGPGSYTGLRIGAAFAKGFCYALNIPLITFSTLQLIAANAKVTYPNATTIIPMIDARRDEVYVGVYSNALDVVEADTNLILSSDSFERYNKEAQVVFCGDGAAKTALKVEGMNFLFDATTKPSTVHWGELAEAAFQQKQFADLAYFEPYYIKAVYTTTPNPAKKLL